MPIDQIEKNRRNALSNAEAMEDAQILCVPCRLCGGSAKITDAGTGWGYYITCENAEKRVPQCIIGEIRKSGWAYNVMELWNLFQTPMPVSKYLNLVDGKIYELVSQDSDGVTFKREGRETPHYLGRAEFDRRFHLQTPTPETTMIGRELSGELLVALSAVCDERARQQRAEGWTSEHDDCHTNRSMALAGACYAMFAAVSDSARASTDMPGGLTVSGDLIPGWNAWRDIWPWARSWWKPTDRRRDLIKAAALIIAEIARLDRATAATEGSAG